MNSDAAWKSSWRVELGNIGVENEGSSASPGGMW
jgi:hypothetical protein